MGQVVTIGLNIAKSVSRFTGPALEVVTVSSFSLQPVSSRLC